MKIRISNQHGNMDDAFSSSNTFEYDPQIPLHYIEHANFKA